MSHLVGFDQASELLRFIQHRIDMLRLGEILRLAAARHEAHFLAFGDFFDYQRAGFALNFAGDGGIADLRVVQGDIEIPVAEYDRALAIDAALQQAGGCVHRARLAPQRHRGSQTVKADVHNRAVREGRIEGIGIFAVEIALIAGRVLAVVNKGFAQLADLVERLFKQQEIWQAGGFERFEEHHVIFPRRFDCGFNFLQVRGQRFFANHVLFMAQEQAGLREVQRVWAGDIDRVNVRALR